MHNKSLHTLQCATPLGMLTLTAHDTALVGADFDQVVLKNTPQHHQHPQHPVLLETQRQLQQYFAQERTVFDLPLDLSNGTPFQQSVWHSLLPIAFGTTCSYSHIAQAIGNERAVRAVGGAIGRNPISIIVPCHRVIGRDGSLTGYSGGMHRKIALLQREGVL